MYHNVLPPKCVSSLKLCISALKFPLIHPVGVCFNACVCVLMRVSVFTSAAWSQAYTVVSGSHHHQKLAPWGIMHEKKASLGAHQFHRLNWTPGGVCMSVCLCGAFIRWIFIQCSCFVTENSTDIGVCFCPSVPMPACVCVQVGVGMGALSHVKCCHNERIESNAR